jgi:titin
VGGGERGEGNVLSGNLVGVVIAGVTASGNLVQGNLIGTDLSGTRPVGNSVGVYINGAPGNVIGGGAASARNVVSGNTAAGIEIYGSTATGNMVQGNVVGLKADGQTAFPTSKRGFLQPIGVGVQDASSNTITGNVISGQNVAAVYVFGSKAVTRGNVIRANRIGLATTGTRGPGNRKYGVLLYNAADNTVDRRGASRNVFFGNGIADFREFTGPVPATRPSGSRLRAAAAQAWTPGHDGSGRTRR